jgi:hypothetical protein
LCQPSLLLYLMHLWPEPLLRGRPASFLIIGLTGLMVFSCEEEESFLKGEKDSGRLGHYFV